jgi:ABC-type multidrug transport system fused ATPase/permease subunit
LPARAVTLPASFAARCARAAPVPDSALPRRLHRLRATFRFFYPYAQPDSLLSLLAAIVVVSIAVTNTVMIWLIGTPVDLLSRGEFNDVGFLAAVFALLMTVNQGLHYAYALLLGQLGLRFVERVRGAMVSHFMSVSFPAMHRYQRGDVLSRLSSELDSVAALVVDAPLALVSHAAIFLFYAAMLLWIDVRLALLALAISPLFLLHQRLFAERNRRITEAFFKAGSALLSRESETLENLRDISSFGAQDTVSRLHRIAFQGARDWSMKAKKLDALFDASLAVLVYLCGLAVLVAGVYEMQLGQITLGALVSFLLYIGYLSVPVRGVTQLAVESQGAVAAGERAREMLEIPVMVQEAVDARPLVVTNGAIACKSLTFAYSSGQPVFKDLDLAIAGGETVALVGPSGSGKSTFARMLVRFYDPLQGRVEVDGTDLREVTLDSLRRQVSVVWQEPFVASGTIRDNLLIAKPEAREEDMLAACRAGHAWEFIVQWNEGLDTRVGIGGIDLSTGQRQRLALAQAFLRDAPILILDEPSSGLDSHAEQRLVKALDRLRRERTTLIIAHRYSSIRTADRVVYFNGDGSVSSGTHEQLARNHPGYRNAVQWQTVRPLHQ